MQTIFKSIKIIFEISIIMILYYITGTFLPVIYQVSILCWSAVIIIVLLFNYNFLIKLFIKEEKKEKKDLFNIYYINHPKVFEICMLINNKRKSKEELSIKDEETQKMTLALGGNIIKAKNSFSPSISNENSATKTYEYKELQEIKETNSTYLSEIIKKCKTIDDNQASNGSLVKIDDVKLQIVNRDEIAQINSMLSGIFKDSNISTVSDGQVLNIDINAIGNILLKDYKYSLKGEINNNEFYISIPIKAEKEFENDYSIYDLEIGKVNIIGIYRTDNYKYKNNSTFNFLQESGKNGHYVEDDLLKSNTSRRKTKNAKKNDENKSIYIDLIAIVQDLDIKGVSDNE
jgi:hypothetical protein